MVEYLFYYIYPTDAHVEWLLLRETYNIRYLYTPIMIVLFSIFRK